MNERLCYHRVVLSVPRDAQPPVSWSHTSVQPLGCVLAQLGSDEYRRVPETSLNNGYSVTVSAEGHGSVNERMCSPSYVYVCSGRMRRELQRRAGSNGYSVTVSAEAHGSVNELVPHHLVVSCVLRAAQQYRHLSLVHAYRSSEALFLSH